MNISVRRKEISGGRESLFLDYYLPKAKQKRRKESLGLHLYKPPKTKLERDHNKKVVLLAESIRSKKLLELQHKENGFGHLLNVSSDESFMVYFEKLTDDRYSSQGNYGNWDSTLKHIKKFAGDKLMFSEVDQGWLEDFKRYLKEIARSKSNKPLSQNTIHSYFNKVKASLRQAFREKKIDINPALDVQGFKQEDTEREFLTLEELKSTTKVECEIPILKQAFLFSCLTGLRWSDINKLTWQEVQFSEEQGWYIRFKQKKTKGFETLPISQQARDYLGENPESEERVFIGLKYSAWHNLKLQQWVMKAGISKTITFHCARHTYATLQLTLGTDIYTVSKLLGHKDLKTTQVYAKIIDQKKVDAANVIPNISTL
ncbi:MAG: site-specific integrase [Crocinitomicaceae bacterium]|nr:site-specific integrase [Crocinitomicaceae bacterium]